MKCCRHGTVDANDLLEEIYVRLEQYELERITIEELHEHIWVCILKYRNTQSKEGQDEMQ